MSSSPDNLSERFPLDGVRFEVGQGGLTKVVVETDLSTGEMYLHGAHVTAFQPTGRLPVLWLSERAVFKPGQPIRGGVPVCFPWFGPHPTDTSAPSHGPARIKQWDLVAVTATEDGGVTIAMQTTVEPYTVAMEVTFGVSLEMAFHVGLPPEATHPATFEVALHSYFNVGDITQISIQGLESTRFIDKTDGATVKPGTGKPLRFEKEWDAVYLETHATCVLNDPVLGRTLEVSKTNSENTVVWNPWIEKSGRMPDFGDDEWVGMVCVETANCADGAVTLQPGQSHVMTAKISVAS